MPGTSLRKMKIRVLEDDTTVILRPTGEVDAFGALCLRERGLTRLAQGFRAVLLDLSDAEIVDSGTLWAILDLWRRIMTHNQPGECLAVVTPQNRSRNAIEGCRLGEILPVFPNVGEALDAIRGDEGASVPPREEGLFIMSSRERRPLFERRLRRAGYGRLLFASTLREGLLILVRDKVKVLIIDSHRPLVSIRSLLDQLSGINRNNPVVISAPRPDPAEESDAGEQEFSPDPFLLLVRSALDGETPAFASLIYPAVLSRAIG